MKIFSHIRAALLSVALGVLFLTGAVMGPALAAAPPLFSPDIALEFTGLQHLVSIEAAAPNLSAGKAFIERARSHDLFASDGFGFGRIEPRL